MKKIGVFLVFIFLISCTSNTIFKKPDDLIPKDTMELLILDMTIASSAKYSKNINLEKNINYMQLVFAKYNIDSARFNRSNIYYTSKIDDYKKILDSVKQRIEDLKKKYADEKNVLDSIRRDSIKLRSDLLALKKENSRLDVKDKKTIIEILEGN